jgi:hypothetical protein
MTCHVDDYQYGHAGCCGCERDLDLATLPSFLTCQQGNLYLYIFYCPECFAGLEEEGVEACKKAVAEVLNKGMTAVPSLTGLAMITSLALQAHGGDLVRAYEIGVEVPRILHDAILAGQTEVAIVPPFGWEA